jgi:hypothetical protein
MAQGVSVGQPDGTTRVESALYLRCRRGEAEALSTLLYRLVDRLYTAASFVCPDEQTAVLAVAGTWEDLLLLLLRPRVGGKLEQRACGLLKLRLLDFAEPAALTNALQCSRQADPESLVAYPESALPALLALIPLYTDRLAEAARVRRSRDKQVLGGLVALLVLVVGLQVWLALERRSAGLELTTLRDRIVKRNLTLAVRDTLGELSDPTGADAPEAQTLQRVLMALEDIVSASEVPQGADMRFLKQRLRQEDLAEALATLMIERDGLAQHELAQAQLVLEEVQAL